MIIDCHAHMGKMLNFNMPEEMIISSMARYGIDFTLVSNIEGAEVDHNQIDIPLELQFTQTEINMKAVNFARRFPEKIGVLLWIKPKTETVTEDFRQFIKENREYIYGIKVHPYHSNTAFDSEKMNPYFKLAEEFNLPIVTHTAKDDNSHPEVVERVAIRHPELSIVLYHLGLGMNNDLAIQIIKKHDNLFGDISWVKPEKMLKALKECGADKIMFGTDNPINGIDTYHNPEFYDYCFNDLKNNISEEDYDKFMYKTAKKLFRITKV